jgi:hypothetical protein
MGFSDFVCTREGTWDDQKYVSRLQTGKFPIRAKKKIDHDFQYDLGRQIADVEEYRRYARFSDIDGVRHCSLMIYRN